MRNITQDIDAVRLYKPYLRPIEDDALGIARRIRDIDDGYFIVYNILQGDFEVHHVDNKGATGTYSLTLPYDSLDARTLDYVRRRERANTEKLIAELNAANEKIENEKRRDAHNKFEDAAHELASDLRRAL